MRIGFIGAGQMARALAKGFVEGAGVVASDIIASDCNDDSLAGFEAVVPGSQTTKKQCGCGKV